MIRALMAMPGGLRVILGINAQDYSKLVHGKALTIDTSDLSNSVMEVMLVYKATTSELVRELREAGLIGPQTEIVKGQPE